MDFDAVSKIPLGDLIGRAINVQDEFSPSDSDFAIKLASAIAEAVRRGKDNFEPNIKEILSLFSGGSLTPETIEQRLFPVAEATEEPVTVTKTTTSVGNTPVEENVETSTPDTSDALAQELSMSDDDFQKLLDEIPDDDDTVSGKDEPPKDFGEVPGEKELYLDAAKSKAEKGKPAEDMGSTPEEKDLVDNAAQSSEEKKEDKPAEEKKEDKPAEDKPADDKSDSKKEDNKQEQSDTDRNIIGTLTDLK